MCCPRQKCVKQPAAINNKHCFLVSGPCSIKPNKTILLHLAAEWLTKVITHFYFLELIGKLLGAVQLFQINAAKYMYETHIIYGKMQLLTHPSSLSSQLYQAHQ